MLFGVLTTITGSIFARAQWQVYWNWDPRELSIIMLLVLYGAYFALRSSVEEEEKRATLGALYVVFSFAPMIFLVFVMPRIPALKSLHPNLVQKGGGMSSDYYALFMASMIGFGALYAWIYGLQVKIARLADRRAKESMAEYVLR